MTDEHINHPLLGRRVTATVGIGEAVTTRTGVLLAVTADGDVDIRTDDGHVHYLWPLITINEVPAP